jgi:hypothetical protein
MPSPIDAVPIWLTGEETAAIRGFVDATCVVLEEKF